MKKVIILLLIISFLSSCSGQKKMNAEIFTERLLAETNDEFEIKNIVYNNENAEIYLRDKKHKEYVLKSYADSYANVCKITLTGDGTQADFDILSDKIIKAYSPEIISEMNSVELFINSFDYAETQWYYLTSARNEKILFFSIENKKLSAPKNTEFTLKPNDITITKGSE